MLLLTRSKGESVMIGNEVKVTFLGMHNGEIRLGFEAPKEISIHRKEVYDRMLKENNSRYEN